jgi:uncharacterized protein (TIGR02266 family)
MDQPSSTESSAITLRIRFKSASLDEFISRYGADVSPGGIFIRTKQPVDVGTSLQFDFTLADSSALLSGLGTVAWVRESDPARANNIPGMGLRFDKLSLESQHTHQVILAEKARKEGKEGKEGKAQSTPYPPTAAPAAKPSPSPEVAHATSNSVAATEPGVTNFAVTRPAPAAISPFALATAAPAAPVQENVGDTDEFESAGKTEISDKPLDYYLKEAAREAEAGDASMGKSSENAVPTSLFDDQNTDEEVLPVTKSGPPPAGILAQESSAVAAEKLPAKPASGERKIGDKDNFTSLLDLGMGTESAQETAAAPTETLEEISAGAPIEEAPSEMTEEVAPSPAKLLETAPESLAIREAPIDLDRPPSQDDMPSVKPKGAGKLIAGVAMLTAAAAFGVVYLITTKPWQQAPEPESQPVAAAAAATAPLPVPVPTPAPAADPAAAAAPAPAPAAEAVAKPAAEEAAKPSAVAAAIENNEPQKSAATEKPTKEKPQSEKAVVAKAGQETPVEKSTGKSASHGVGNFAEEKSNAEGEEVSYHEAFKSVPSGAEVLIDGEYYGHTPCFRRVLDPSKPAAVTFRRAGFEPSERVLGAEEKWVKKGNDRVLTVTVHLKKAEKPSASEPSSALSVSPAAPKIENAPGPAPIPEVKPALLPEPTRPAASPAPLPVAPKPEPAKAAVVPTEKPAVSKPAPNF